MAIENIKIGMTVSSNGTTEKEIKLAKDLKAGYDSAASSAAKLGGTSGSRAAAAKAAPVGSESLMSGQQYGQMRGSAGVTGASARDFANQAQGLGGLVRLYATYAANVFAVGAAFTALKGAADTTNLVKGLDTLGAASGRNLGALSKQLVAATDGAISLREAMAATAVSSSAGMSNESIRRLAGVAKTASLALGIAMPDALNRLSRGIVKLEPELLDELGLFTKIGPATEKYALEIGKTASQLTDFERRQAFANAVLEEGEKKFSALADVAANPYDKLLASLKNVAHTGLELINVVLVPIVSLLSQNPTALGAGLLAIAGIVVKQALPAIGQLKEGLKASADSALAAAKNKASDAVRAREQLNALIEARVEASADFELNKFEELEAKLTGAREKGLRKRGALYKILEKDIIDITDLEIKSAEKSVSALETKAKKDPRLEQVAKLERATLDQLKSAITAEEQVTAVRLQNRAIIEQQIEKSGQLAKVQKAAADYELKAKKDAIIANTAYNSSLLGMTSSWRLFRAQVEAADLKLKLIPASILMIRGAMASLTNAVVVLGATLNKAFAIVAILATAYSVLELVFSKGAKEQEKFSNALDASKSSVDNVARTLEALKDSAGIEQSNIQSTLALSNAMTELADTAKAARKALTEAKTAGGWVEDSLDWLKSWVGKDRASEASKALSKQVFSAIELLKREGLDKEFESALSKIFNVTEVTIESLPELIKGATEAQKDALYKLLEGGKSALGNLSSALQKFKESSDASLKSYKEFLQSTLDTSPLFKLGESLVQTAIDMQTAALQSGNVTKMFDELVKNPEKAALFGSTFVKEFASIRDEFVKQQKEIVAWDTKIKDLTSNLENLKKVRAGIVSVSGGVVVDNSLDKQIAQKESALATAKEFRLTLDGGAVQKAQRLLTEGIAQGLKNGLDLATRALKEAQAAAGAAVAKANTAALSGPRKIEAEADIQRKQLVAQLDLINGNIELVNVQEQLVAEIRLANALEQAKKDPTKQAEVDFAKAGAAIAQGLSASLEGFTPAQQVQLQGQQNLKTIRDAQQQATSTRVSGELRALNIGTGISSARSRVQEATETANLQANINKLQADQLGILQSISGVTSTEITKSQQSLDLVALKKKQTEELNKLNKDIDLAKAGEARTTGKEQAQYTKEVGFLEGRKKLLVDTQKLELEGKLNQDRLKLLQDELQVINKTYEKKRSDAAVTQAEAAARLDVREAELNVLTSTYGVSNEYSILEQARLETARAQLDRNNAAAAAESVLNQKREESTARIAAINALQGLSEDNKKAQIDEINAELTRQVGLNSDTLKILDAQLDSKLKIADLTKEAKLDQERHNQLLRDTASVAEVLKSVFGEVGEKLGNVANTFAEIAINTEKRAKAETALQKAMDTEEDPAKKKAIETALGKEKAKNAKAELSDNIKLVASTKNLFKEKTGAYKVLNATEKAMHLARLAMDAKELVVKLFTLETGTAAKAGAEVAETGMTFAGTAARLTAYATDIYGKTIGQLGPIAGPIVATALVAALFAMFGKGGSKSAPSAFSANSEQIQETQGTGQTYDSSGKLVVDVGGILGDDEAKANSIVNSLEILQKNSFKSLDYDNRLLRSFQGVAEAIGKATGAVITSGLRTLPNSIAMMLGTTQTGGFGSNIPFTVPLVGKVLDSILGGGKSETQSLNSQRLELSGTFSDVANDIGSGLRQVTDILVKWKKDGGWFSSDKSGSYIKQIVGTVPEDINDAFAAVFSNLKSGYETIAELAGTEDPIGFVAEKLKTVRLVDSQGNPLKFDYTGLKGDEIRTELEAYFSKINNIAIEALFPEFGEFQQAGEDYGTTAMRVLQNTKEISLAFMAMGKSFTATGMAAYRLTDELAKAAGGVDNFVDQAKYFIDNFLTSDEKLEIAQKAVTSQLSKLGLSANLTKDQFKALVKGVDVTTASGRELYQSLMDLAPGFVEFQDLMEQSTSAATSKLSDFASSIREFAKNIKAYRDSLLIGPASPLTPQERYGLSRNQLMSTYELALSGDKTAMNALQGQVSSFLDLSKTLFSSSSQYISDFNTVMSMLDEAQSTAFAQADIADQQLAALENHTLLLQNIDAGIAKLAGITPAASGGYRQGLTLVGELGPEIVDFATPARVYTADQTAGMFQPRSGNTNQTFVLMVNELKDLKNEVAQLRKDQQKQTGDMIVTNYDATNKLAEQIAEAVTTTVTDASWQDRNKVTLK